MSKRAKEAAIKAYPLPNFAGMIENDASIIASQSTFKAREYYIEGYEQAEKDVWDRIEKYLSNRNPTDYATVGWILKNIEEYKKKIMEE